MLFVQLCTYYILSWWEGHGKTVLGRFSASARWSHRDLVTREFLLQRVRGVGPESLHFCKLPADGPASSQGFRTNFVFVGRLCSAALFFFFHDSVSTRAAGAFSWDLLYQKKFENSFEGVRLAEAAGLKTPLFSLDWKPFKSSDGIVKPNTRCLFWPGVLYLLLSETIL